MTTEACTERTAPRSPSDTEATLAERPRFPSDWEDPKLSEAERCFALGDDQRALVLANAVFKTNRSSGRAAELIARVWFERGRSDLSLEWARAYRSIAPGPKADDLVNLASYAIKEERKRLLESPRREEASFDAAKTVELPCEAFVD